MYVDLLDCLRGITRDTSVSVVSDTDRDMIDVGIEDQLLGQTIMMTLGLSDCSLGSNRTCGHIPADSAVSADEHACVRRESDRRAKI